MNKPMKPAPLFVALTAAPALLGLAPIAPANMADVIFGVHFELQP